MHYILFRRDDTNRDELLAAIRHFAVATERLAIPLRSDVIPRYSALPFYDELKRDLDLMGSRLINSYGMHRWIANFDYYEAVRQYTPKTWFRLQDIDEPGPYVVKGRTNSRKLRWNRDMLALDREHAIQITSELLADSLIGLQDIVYRKYIHLNVFDRGLYDLPYSNEHRFFYLGTRRIAHGYYWSDAPDPDKGYITREGLDLADEIAAIVCNYANFFVLDIAETAEGDWILIEVNDGSMAGLSCIDPDVFYENLRDAVS